MKFYRLKTKGIGFLTTLLTLSFLSMGANKLGDVEIKDLTVTGASVGVTAASAAPDWLTATNYGVNEIVVDPNSGITYRSNQAHLSTGTNLTDDAAKYDVIGSAGNGVIVTAWQTFVPAWNTGTRPSDWIERAYYRRVGEDMEIYYAAKSTSNSGASAGAGPYSMEVPGGYSINFSQFYDQNGGADASYAGSGWMRGGGVYYHVKVAPNSSNGRMFFWLNGAADTTTTYWASSFVAWNSASPLLPSMYIKIPIAEWQNSGVTVSIQDLTEETVWLTESTIPITIQNASSGLSFAGGNFKAYKDSNDVYYLEGNLEVVAAPLDSDFQILLGGGVTFYDIQHQAVTVSVNSAGSVAEPSTRGRTNANTNEIAIQSDSSLTEVWVTLKVRLKEKPTFFDANRENPAAVSAFVPEATPSSTGLLPPPTLMNDSLATSLGHKTYTHTGSYNGGNIPTLGTDVGSISNAVTRLVPYQMQNGTWRLRYTISAVLTASAGQGNLTINSVVGVASLNQAGGAHMGGAATDGHGTHFFQPGGNFTWFLPGAASNPVHTLTTGNPIISGDVELSSKPNWAY